MAKIKKSEFINLHIKSPYANLSKDGMVSVVRKQYELLPSYRPEKWGKTEPLRQVFDPTNVEQIWPDGGRSTVDWKKSGKNRATGHWTPLINTYVGDNHAYLALTVYETQKQYELIDAIKKLGVYMETDYAFIDAFTLQYKPFASENSRGTYLYLSYSTHLLRHWLPDMTWATVFGPAYMRLFGKDNLLSVPAYRVEDLGPEHVFIQLTASLDDLFEKFEEVMDAREVAKQHLGYDCFFQAGKAYNWKQEPEKAGKVFRTPEFHMHDDYVQPKTLIENPETDEVAELVPGQPLPEWFLEEPSRPVVSYEKAEWHYGSDRFPQFLPPEQGAIHIGIFIAWCINNEWLVQKKSKAVRAVKNRLMTGTQFLMQEQGEKFLSSILNIEIQPFVNDYYHDDSSEFAKAHGSYYDDFAAKTKKMTQISGKMSPEIRQKSGEMYELIAFYLVNDNWENYDLIASVISQRYSEWQAFPGKSE